MSWRLLKILGLFLTLASPAVAQTIRVTISDGSTGADVQVGTFASGAAILITTSQLNTVTSNNPGEFLRIYDTSTDNNGAPTLDIGPVTIRVDTGLGFRPQQLRVLVAAASEPDIALNLTDPEQPFADSGARNFRSLVVDATSGIIAQEPTVVEDFQRNLSLAIAIQGDLGQALAQPTDPRDQVKVGSIFRAQVNRQPGSTTLGGNIHADITATGADNIVGFWYFTIAQMRVANSITGSINATGHQFSTSFPPSPGSINKVVVGPNPSTGSVGLAGDVKAEAGEINEVYSAAPIGSASKPVKIWAGNRIKAIRVAQEGSSAANATVLSHDIHADIRSNLASSLSGDPGANGALHLVQTDGGLMGEVKAGNLSPGYFNIFSGGGPGCQTGLRQEGLLVRGAIDAPITIDFNQENTDIVADRILKPVKIGIKSKGLIVAYGTPTTSDPDAGFIHSINIGFGSVPTEYEAYPTGMCGHDCVPLDMSGTDPWFSAGTLDVASKNSLIRADHIGTIRINKMTLLFDGDTQTKQHKPRIEAKRIESLSIAEMGAGVVWSGVLDGNAASSNVRSNDYASIGDLRIGCMSPLADVWATECPAIVIGEYFTTVINREPRHGHWRHARRTADAQDFVWELGAYSRATGEHRSAFVRNRAG